MRGSLCEALEGGPCLSFGGQISDHKERTGVMGEEEEVVGAGGLESTNLGCFDGWVDMEPVGGLPVETGDTIGGAGS